MAHTWHTEGMESLLDAYFNGTGRPTNVYLRLAADAAPAVATTLSALTEVTGTGYAAIAIPTTAGSWTSLLSGSFDRIMRMFMQQTFTAGGTWDAANLVYLATSSDDNGKLLCSGPPTGAPVTLLNGETHIVKADLSILAPTTLPWNTEGIQDVLEVYFQAATRPTNLYLGMCTDASIARDAVLTDLTEITGTDYARIVLPTNSVHWTSQVSNTVDWMVRMAQGTYTAGGTWVAANSVFLATTADNTGRLVATATVRGAPLTMAITDQYLPTMDLILQTSTS